MTAVGWALVACLACLAAVSTMIACWALREASDADRRYADALELWDLTHGHGSVAS